ncbi:MAG: hypothetical protein ACP5RS_00100 [Thermoplasmata archaeon]
MVSSNIQKYLKYVAIALLVMVILTPFFLPHNHYTVPLLNQPQIYVYVTNNTTQISVIGIEAVLYEHIYITIKGNTANYTQNESLNNTILDYVHVPYSQFYLNVTAYPYKSNAVYIGNFIVNIIKRYPANVVITEPVYLGGGKIIITNNPFVLGMGEKSV